MKDLLSWAFPRLRDRARVRVLMLAVLVGVLGGAAAVAFEFAMDAVAWLVFGNPNPALGGFGPVRALVGSIVAALLAGAATLLTTTGTPQGIADVISHARGARPSLTARDAAASALSAVLTIGGGQSAGREGPIVQIAGSASVVACARLGVPPGTSRVLSAAAAAGAIAASFNSPLGGTFFALEVILGTLALDAFAPVVVAGVAGTLVGQLLLGDRLALVLPPFKLHHGAEILLFPLLGVACGVVTIAFRAALDVAKRQLARVPGPAALRPLFAGVFVGVLAAVGMPDAMGNGYARLEVLIGAEHPAFGFLVALLLAKLVATALSAAGRSGGGMFAPALFLGATAGLLCGRAFGALLPGVDPDLGTFAIAGMAGVAASVTHAPATMALMLAEMTGNYAVVLPLLVTIASAQLVTRIGYRSSLYVDTLAGRGIRLDNRADELGVDGLRVGDVMHGDGYATAAADASFEELATLFLAHPRDEVFVVEADRKLLGLVDLQDVKALLQHPPEARSTARELVREAPTVRAEAPVSDAVDAFYVTGFESLPVVDADGHLVAVVTERDLMGALRRGIGSIEVTDPGGPGPPNGG